jgi:large subunit ribosomal protein L9
MAVAIEVVLRDALTNLGEAGELVRVRPGYARNYLIPRGLAVLASKGNVRQVEHERSLAKTRAQKRNAELSELGQRLEAVSIELTKSAGEDGRLFGSVTTKEVADALEHQGIKVDRKVLAFKEPVRHVGEYECIANLGASRHVAFKVRVAAK